MRTILICPGFPTRGVSEEMGEQNIWGFRGIVQYSLPQFSHQKSKHPNGRNELFEKRPQACRAKPAKGKANERGIQEIGNQVDALGKAMSAIAAKASKSDKG